MSSARVGFNQQSAWAGVGAFLLPEIQSLSQARKLRSRTFALGSDVLFDCETVR